VKRLTLLGSTGSIGTQTLEVVERNPERLRVVGLAAGRNVDLLIQQTKQFRPAIVSVAGRDEALRVREAISEPGLEVVWGADGLVEVARREADLAIGALVGGVGLEPVVAALRNGVSLALANKEVLVMAGALVLREARRSGARLLPLDSEHVAIHQCLASHARAGLKRIVLTASGGPFRTWSGADMARATPEQALAHPNWDMGPKISIDSATMMNKGLEVIEARWLFDVEPQRIEVLIHRESVIHSMVEFVDGNWLAQLAIPDMRIPIAYTLGMPDRLPLPDLPALDLAAVGTLHFERPDTERFPALRLAVEAAEAGGTAPALLNAANEVAVSAFLERRIPFPGIAATVQGVLQKEQVQPGLDLAEIREADHRARTRARWLIDHYSA
jgi:1-deoxy-D-xylulose-5-phosphate reductoisomerase